MKLPIYTTFMLFMLFLASCEKTEKIENFPKAPSRIVMNSILLPDSGVTVILYKSLSILDNAYNKVLKEARVDLYLDDSLISTLESSNVNNLYYFQDVIPLAGHRYMIKASEEGYETVTATTTIPEAVRIREITPTVQDTASWNNYYSPNYYYSRGYITVKFKDPGIGENYYALTVYQIDTVYMTSETGDTISKEVIRMGIQGYDGPYISPLIEFNDASRYYFSDQFFNGNEIGITLPVTYYGYWKRCNLEVELRSLSDDAFFFEKSVTTFNDNSENPFSEPIKLYSNIENGYGIFGGSSKHSMDVRFY